MHIGDLSMYERNLRSLQQKHFNEFISIFSVTEVPKIKLKRLSVPAAFDVTISGDAAVAVQSVGSVKVFRAVPLWVLAECVHPGSVSPPLAVNKWTQWKSLLIEIFVPAVLRNHRSSKPPIFTNTYYSIDNTAASVPGTASLVSLAGRLERALHRFKDASVSGSGMLVISSPPAYDRVPLILLSAATGSGLFQLSIVHYSESLSLEVSTVYLPSAATEQIVYAAVPSIYGFEENPFPECMICCERPVNTLLIDCFHSSTCEECTNSFRDGKCPICRKPVMEQITIPVRTRSTGRDSDLLG